MNHKQSWLLNRRLGIFMKFSLSLGFPDPWSSESSSYSSFFVVVGWLVCFGLFLFSFLSFFFLIAQTASCCHDWPCCWYTQTAELDVNPKEVNIWTDCLLTASVKLESTTADIEIRYWKEKKKKDVTVYLWQKHQETIPIIPLLKCNFLSPKLCNVTNLLLIL